MHVKTQTYKIFMCTKIVEPPLHCLNVPQYCYLPLPDVTLRERRSKASERVPLNPLEIPRLGSNLRSGRSHGGLGVIVSGHSVGRSGCGSAASRSSSRSGGRSRSKVVRELRAARNEVGKSQLERKGSVNCSEVSAVVIHLLVYLQGQLAVRGEVVGVAGLLAPRALDRVTVDLRVVGGHDRVSRRFFGRKSEMKRFVTAIPTHAQKFCNKSDNSRFLPDEHIALFFE